MKRISQNTITLVLLFLTTSFLFSQKKDENIGNEVVNVVKPYSPTVSDAFKVKETPTFEDEETAQKETIQYNIFSFPVASTFTPSKGRAEGVEKTANEKLFSNYLTLAAGNYGAINAELSVTQLLENNNYVGALLRHFSSQGGIKEVDLKDNFFNTGLEVTYGNKSKDKSWNANLGYQNQIYNWYGLQSELFNEEIKASINPQQTYHTLNVGGKINLSESIFKSGTIQFIRFWDAFSSSENRFYAKPALELDIMDQKIKTNFVFDYIGTSFKKDYLGLEEIKQGYTNLGITPSIQINKDDLALNAGVSFFYSMNNIEKENKFFIYPNITASYKVVGNLMIAYAGAEGALNQNSYHDFVQTNFFVSPTLIIAPTDQKYDIYAGLKGKLDNTIGYNIRASVNNETNKPMFKNNLYNSFNTSKEGYNFGNSFEVVYDQVKTVSFFGEIKADFSKNASLGINATLSSYATEVEEEPWNLPSFKAEANLNFNITPKWYAGTGLFFVGERKDITMVQDLSTIFPPTYSPVTTTLESYLDLNTHLGYKHNERLTFFCKGNNLAGQNYQKWINYPVQGIQILLGANYKFDF